jgi:formyltetrahydrofolate-dependent phosphoribosylglycinamide formyltransferase
MNRSADVTRIAVLASGGGSNLQAIVAHLDALGASTPGAVSLVVSDRSAAGALEKARARGVAALHLPAAGPTGALEAALDAHHIDLVVLAGYLRLVPPGVVRRWRGRLVNIHPALLPAFGGHGMYGHHVHDAVIASGVRVSGATVHFVDEHFDRGPIIAQWPVPVPVGDTAAALAARVLAVEHRIYPWCVAALARGEVRLGEDGRVMGQLPYGFDAFSAGGTHPFERSLQEKP